MIRKYLRKQKIKRANFFVEPDEIFLDSKNLQNFDQQQFEGRIEKPIPRKTILVLGFFFLLVVIVFSFRLEYLQIQKGEAYLKRSENNTLGKQIIFADRGIIYDRNKIELAWNKKNDITTTEEQILSTRKYLSPGFSHILGYVSYPMKDKSNIFWQTDFIGKDGLEKQYNNKIKGENGLKIIEKDVYNKIHSENVINAPKRGEDLIISIDSKIQEKLFTIMKSSADNSSFSGGAGVILNINNGEILASTSFPEYNSEILSAGKDRVIINQYFSDKRKVLLDRTISGLYTPGSIVKPFFAIGALTENTINPFKKILSTGSISIPNPYFPDKPSVFKDWKAHGWVDMRDAIAVSSDVYFYAIGGGFEDQKGLGIIKLEKYAKLFGIGEKTGIDLPDESEGIIPSPEWKVKNFNNDPWRIGDTYNTAIGQYGFQVTPMEISRAVSALANYGTLVTPHFILNDTDKESQTSKIDLPKEYFDIVHEGMRQSVTNGTSIVLNVPYVKIAAKTGTAQVGISKNKVNSWVVGFFPYEDPKFVFTIMLEGIPASGGITASSIMRQLLDWMTIYTPEYFK